jgi:hypothetical protein
VPRTEGGTSASSALAAGDFTHPGAVDSGCGRMSDRVGSFPTEQGQRVQVDKAVSGPPGQHIGPRLRPQPDAPRQTL